MRSTLPTSLRPRTARFEHIVTVAVFDGKADNTMVDLRGHETVTIVYPGSYTKYEITARIHPAPSGCSERHRHRRRRSVREAAEHSSFRRQRWVATDLGKAALDTATTAEPASSI
jgi:hypothetical protein